MIMILRMIAEARAQLTNHSQANILKWQIEEEIYHLLCGRKHFGHWGLPFRNLFENPFKSQSQWQIEEEAWSIISFDTQEVSGGQNVPSHWQMFLEKCSTRPPHFKRQAIESTWQELQRLIIMSRYHQCTTTHLVDIGQKSNHRLEHEDQDQQDCVLWTRIVNSLNIRIKKIKIHLIIPKPGDSDSQEQRPCSWTAPRPS